MCSLKIMLRLGAEWVVSIGQLWSSHIVYGNNFAKCFIFTFQCSKDNDQTRHMKLSVATVCSRCCFKQSLKAHCLNTKPCWNLMTGSHNQYGHLSCLISGVNKIGDKSRLSATDNYETVLSSLEMRCEQSFILSRPSFQFATLICLHTCSHWRQDCSVSNILRTTESCRRLSQNETRQDKAQ